MSDNEGDEFHPTISPRRHPPHKLRSAVWNHFTVTDRKNQIAACNWCDRKLSFRTTVTNLKKHVIRKHLSGSGSLGTVTCDLDKTADVSDVRERLHFRQPKEEYHTERKTIGGIKSKLSDLGGLEGLVLNVIGDDGGEPDDNLGYQPEDDVQETENLPQKEQRACNQEKRAPMDPSEKKRRNKIMDLQLECLEIKKYNIQLESLMLEQQLNICRSIFTESLRSEVNSRGTQTDVAGKNTKVLYLAEGNGANPRLHLFATQDDD